MVGRVAIQGIRGSFHHQAAKHYFEQEPDLLECESFLMVVQGVVSGAATFGLMAIENSLAGCILPNYQLLRKNDVKVIGEVGLRVHLNLMALEGSDMSQLVEVRSHQMALRQCEGFFHHHPHLRRVEAFDTAGSAAEIKKRHLVGVGAIAGDLAAEVYGLEIVKEGIEDHDLNYTRFLIIQKGSVSRPPCAEKVSIYFQTSHKPGSLANLLTGISRLGVNLSKLQSHPVPSKNTRYGFYATLELAEPKQLDSLYAVVKRMALDFEILGVYKKGKTHD